MTLCPAPKAHPKSHDNRWRTQCLRASLLAQVAGLALILGTLPNAASARHYHHHRGHKAPIAAKATASAMPVGELTNWPHIDSRIKSDPALEARVTEIVASMSLRQKIGQITQPEIKAITPEEVRQYYIGSVLNGGGSWPKMNNHAPLSDWVALADAYYKASMSTDMKHPVPVIWGIDAVHGNNNIYGATLYPHNIALGAAHDPALIREIGVATAKAVRATGQNWAFAPTLAVVQDQRWGRTYESFSSDPMLVKSYAEAYVNGLQDDFKTDGTVVATAKHFIGDGGTHNGTNEGENQSTRAQMINIHGQGYYGALKAGVQTVMASYNSWNDISAGVNYGKMHPAASLLNGALKADMGFDGFVISDWDAIKQLPGCTVNHCPQAINAGVDMIMVPFEWKAFIENTVADVQSGAIPMKRIDDAVARIVRVKLRAHLFDQAPSASQFAGHAEALVNHELGRRAVRESAVLLKNNAAALPIRPNARILVVGKNADNLPNQFGGWSMTWQGDNTTNADFPNATSLLSAIVQSAGQKHVTYSRTAEGVNLKDFDVVIAVIGETPYAETKGDIGPGQSLKHTDRYPEDLAVLKSVSNQGPKVITLMESGRTLYTNDLINLSDAFVAAWLPGSESQGLTDLLFAKKSGRPAYDFRGTLSFDWPNSPCPVKGMNVLFARGYGLTYQHPKSHISNLKIDTGTNGCVDEPIKH